VHPYTTSNQCGNKWVGPWRTVFDPIDGTKSFITGKPLFGTLVALLKVGPATADIARHVIGAI